MFLALVITNAYVFIIWLVFFRLKLLKFSIAWGLVSSLVGVHVLLIFLIGLRFVTPYSTDATVIQHTIQLIPRLPEPTVVMEVLVEPNVPVKKGQSLFQFDRRPYEYKVRQLEAALAQAQQGVSVLQADLEAATEQVAKHRSDLIYAQAQWERYRTLASKNAGSEEELQRWNSQLKSAEAALKQAQADEKRARAKYGAQVGGVNAGVVQAQADLDQARYYLENTTMVAPEDGFITNLQVRPGMVAGIVRLGAIASFIADADRYLLATYNQETLKYVKPGQPAEIVLDLYPGGVFQGKVQAIWWASGEGQLLPSGDLPSFKTPPPNLPQGRFAVAIALDQAERIRFPIGAQGAAAIYTSSGPWAFLRKIGIRARSWLLWLYPMPF
ncbi:MAG TPA: HlyD family secretion protein [Dermatophilaceae bacterium]